MEQVFSTVVANGMPSATRKEAKPELLHKNGYFQGGPWEDTEKASFGVVTRAC